MSCLLQDGKIDNAVAEGDADPRQAGLWFKNAERKIFQREMRLARNVDERFKRHLEKEIECAQIFARLVEATTAKRSHEFPARFDPVEGDFPIPPRENG